MTESITKCKGKINAWAKEAIELEQEYNAALSIAKRHQANYDANGDQLERKNAIRFLGKAWKAAKRIIAIKESIHWEANAIEKVQLSLLETAPPSDAEEKHLIYADAGYFKGVSDKALTERDEYLNSRRDIIREIRKLRLPAHNIATA